MIKFGVFVDGDQCRSIHPNLKGEFDSIAEARIAIARAVDEGKYGVCPRYDHYHVHPLQRDFATRAELAAARPPARGFGVYLKSGLRSMAVAEDFPTRALAESAIKHRLPVDMGAHYEVREVPPRPSATGAMCEPDCSSPGPAKPPEPSAPVVPTGKIADWGFTGVADLLRVLREAEAAGGSVVRFTGHGGVFRGTESALYIDERKHDVRTLTGHHVEGTHWAEVPPAPHLTEGEAVARLLELPPPPQSRCTVEVFARSAAKR